MFEVLSPLTHFNNFRFSFITWTFIEGRVFIDEDPDLIKIIVNFLRKKKREDPEKPFRLSPRIPDGKKEDFHSLLDYYGLTTFFGESRSAMRGSLNDDIVDGILRENSSRSNGDRSHVAAGQRQAPSDGGLLNAAANALARPPNIHNNRGRWGNAFVANRNSWRCEMCFSQNSNNLNECASCTHPRPVQYLD